MRGGVPWHGPRRRGRWRLSPGPCRTIRLQDALDRSAWWGVLARQLGATHPDRVLAPHSELPTVEREGSRVNAGETQESHPLSYGQRSVWLWDRRVPGKFRGTLNISAIWPVGDGVSRHAIKEALAALADRHETLRTRYLEIGGTDEAVQHILEQVSFNVPVLHVKGDDWAVDDYMLEAPKHVVDFVAQPFVVTEELNWRAAIIAIRGECRYVCFVCHHIVLDMAGLSILGDQLISLLDGTPLDELPKPELQPRLLAQRERSSEGTPSDRRLLDFWRSQLRNLPALAIHSREGSDLGTRRTLLRGVLNSSLDMGDVDAAAKIHKVSVQQFLLSLLALALSEQFEPSLRIPVRLVCWNRFTPAERALVGNIAQTTMVVVDVSKGADFGDLVRGTQGRVIQAFRYARFNPSVIDGERESMEAGLGAAIDVPFSFNSQMDRRIHRPRRRSHVVRASDEFMQLPSVQIVTKSCPKLNVIARSDGCLILDIDVDSELGGPHGGGSVAESILHTVRHGIGVVAAARGDRVTVGEICERINNIPRGLRFSA